jgi:hypothetical protein
MARVAIDPHMFGELWFNAVQEELIKSGTVRFAYSKLPKEGMELSKRRAALQFFKQVGEMKRRDDAHEETCSRFCKALLTEPAWDRNKKVCDDAHFFSLVRTLPTEFIFSKDIRMAKCRDCLNGKVEAEYLRFSLISSEALFRKRRYDILA